MTNRQAFEADDALKQWRSIGRLTALASAPTALLIASAMLPTTLADGEAGIVFLREILRLLLLLGCAGCCLSAAAWGAIAILRRHPRCNRGYREWLAATPWRLGMPLPRGPVRLGRRHLIGAAGLCLTSLAFAAAANACPTALASRPAPIWLPLAGLAPAVLMISGAAAAYYFSPRCRADAWLALTACSLIGIFLPPWISCFALPAAAYGIGWRGTQRDLQQFPWPTVPPAAPKIGWPLSDLMDEPTEFRTSKPIAARRAAVVFLAAVGIGMNIPIPANEAGAEDVLAFVACLTGAGLLVLTRVSGYASACCPRLCWGDRVGGRGWIVPGHDELIGVPLLIVVTGLGLPLALTGVLGAPPLLAVAVSLATAVFVTFGVGTPLVGLHYTGRHAVARGVPAIKTREAPKFIEANT